MDSKSGTSKCPGLEIHKENDSRIWISFLPGLRTFENQKGESQGKSIKKKATKRKLSVPETTVKVQSESTKVRAR